MKNNCKKCYEENKTPNIEDCNYCNMPKKYIIKNCPAHFNNVQMLEFSEGDCNSDKVRGAYCKDNSDCLLKQIVDKCYNATHEDLVITADYKKTARDVAAIYGRAGLADEILKLLEIEEVDDTN